MPSSRLSCCYLIFAPLFLLTFTACGGQHPVPVSGHITLNGEPLAYAMVHFFREGVKKSSGLTDDKGNYFLRFTKDKNGALPGECTVFITTLGEDGEEDEEGNLIEDLIPLRYNLESELTFLVPRGGTNDANFDLTSP